MMAADLREIAALVPMVRVLESLGIEANTRTRRAACVLHSGSNPTAFSWREDGRWHCHSCGAGGDKIALVRGVRKCSFPEAVQFLAVLAGIEWRPGSPSREAIRRERAARGRSNADADTLAALEFAAWRAARDEILRLEAVRRNAASRLEALRNGEPERWSGESESAWAVLADVYSATLHADAAYRLASFAAPEVRYAATLDPAIRETLTRDAPDAGYVRDGSGRIVEVGA